MSTKTGQADRLRRLQPTPRGISGIAMGGCFFLARPDCDLLQRDGFCRRTLPKAYAAAMTIATSPRQLFQPPHPIAILIIALITMTVGGCGGDDDDKESSVSPRVAAACRTGCSRVPNGDCDGADCIEACCEAKEKLAPECAEELADSLECTARANTVGCSHGNLGDDECDYTPWLECRGIR
jgi:hypothetical protein